MFSLRRAHILIGVLAGILLLAHAARYWPFFVDDAFISLRYSERLLHGHGLTWTDGERVEGYSNLLWVLLCALFGASGLDWVLIARLLGMASAAATVWITLAFASTERPAPAWLFRAFSLSLCLPLAAWAIGGLEAPLLAALFVGGLFFLWRAQVIAGDRPLVWPAGTCFALACMTRPDAIVLVAASLVSFLAVHRPFRRAWWRTMAIATIVFVVVVMQELFRVLYYQAWVPNTALIKVAFSLGRLKQGERYLFLGLLPLLGLLLPGALGILLAVRSNALRSRVILLFGPVAAWLLYQLFIGGDWMPASRHLVPILPLFALLGGEGFSEMAAWSRDWNIRAWIFSSFCLLFVGMSQLAHPEAPGKIHAWVWDSQQVGEMLRRAFGDKRPLFAVDSAGALSFYSQLPALDLMGLTDRHIASHPPKNFGHGILGHEHGDGAYALSRHPDLVLFCGPQGGHACYPSGLEMEAANDFSEHYRMVTVDVGAPSHYQSKIWLRLDGPLGLVSTPDKITIPGYLFTGSHALALPQSDGKLSLSLPAGQSAELSVHLPSGVWRATSNCPHLEATVAIDPKAPAANTAIRLTARADVLCAAIVLDLH